MTSQPQSTAAQKVGAVGGWAAGACLCGAATVQNSVEVPQKANTIYHVTQQPAHRVHVRKDGIGISESQLPSVPTAAPCTVSGAQSNACPSADGRVCTAWHTGAAKYYSA